MTTKARTNGGSADDFEEPDTAQIAGLSYEEARDELISVVARLEGGQLPLADSMALWRRGEALAAQCTALLDAAQEQLDDAAGHSDASADGPADLRTDG